MRTCPRELCRNKEREREEMEEKYEAELKLYKQKVKHLMYEHQTNLSETKAEHLVALKLAQDDHAAQENELIKDKVELKKMQQEQELSYMNEIRALKLVRCLAIHYAEMYAFVSPIIRKATLNFVKLQHNSEEMDNMTKRFQSEAAEMEQKYEQKLTNQYESLTLKHRMEITEVEERKSAQIADLIKNHEEAFAEMKTYYNDITQNNLSLIKSMQVIKLAAFVPCEVCANATGLIRYE